MTLRSAGHWQEKRSKTRHTNLKTRLYEDELKYKTYRLKSVHFMDVYLMSAKLKFFFFLKQSFDNLHIHLGLLVFMFIDKNCNDISYFK